MIADASLRWIITALFVFAAGYCGYRIMRVAHWNARIDHGFHLVMCAAMVAMAWPWGLRVPLLPQAVFFTVAAVWFAITSARRTPSSADAHDHHPHGPAMGGYHAFMMAAMVWMVAVMAGWLPGAAAHEHSSDHSPGDMTGMSAHAHTPDMDMSAHSHDAAMSGPGWISAVSFALTVAFALAAIVWLYRLFVAERAAVPAPGQSTPAISPTVQGGSATLAVLPASRLQSAAAACEVAMATGMAIMMGVM